MKLKRLLYLILGCICLGFGCVGIALLIPVTILMRVGFFMMMRKNLFVLCMILAIVWICHIIYFIFGVKAIVAGNPQVE